MKKQIIGILSNLKIVDENLPYDNAYKIIPVYVEKIKEAGGVPIGLLSNDGKLDLEVLDICDGFLMQGGIGINKTHYQLIKYCIKTNKSLLGICLGMQAMMMYDFLVKECNKNEVDVTIDEAYSKYTELKAQDKYFITKLNDDNYHGGNLVSGDLDATIDNIKASIHSINIKEPSILHDVYKSNKIDVISMHRFGTYHEGNLFDVIATSDDGVIEGIQYKNHNQFIVGVQFHAEQENSNLLIKKLVEVSKRK